MAKKQDNTEMKTFIWHGLTKQGERTSGEMDGFSESFVRINLRNQGVNPQKVEEKKGLFGFGKKRSKRIKTEDIAFFSRQLATMIDADVQLVESLNILYKSTGNPKLSGIIRKIHDDVREGNTLSFAMAQHPKYFDNLFVNLVAAGEQSGSLDELLNKIATYKEKTEHIKKKIKKALTYPSAIVFVAFVVMFILLYFVIPQFQTIFQSFNSQLPAFTLMVIHLSNFVQHYWWVPFIGTVASAVAFVYGKKNSKKFNHLLDTAILKVPVVGNIVDKAAVARFARTLSTMFAAGVPMVESLEIVGRASGNYVYEKNINRIKDEVAGGQKLNTSMSQTGLFPIIAVQMIGIGEESGSLDKMSAKIADVYEEEVDEKVDMLSSLLEPLIMVVIGSIVGSLVIAMYLPIFNIGQAINGSS